jgi:hypothetical protein
LGLIVSISGYYYLHRAGALIYRRARPGVVSDFENSELVKCWWPVEPSNRMGAWKILIEATARGADAEAVARLARMWHCDDADAARYAMREGVELAQDAGEYIATLDGAQGRGSHALTAFAALFLACHPATHN